MMTLSELKLTTLEVIAHSEISLVSRFYEFHYHY